MSKINNFLQKVKYEWVKTETGNVHGVNHNVLVPSRKIPFSTSSTISGSQGYLGWTRQLTEIQIQFRLSFLSSGIQLISLRRNEFVTSPGF